ncbi:hypothetical protein ACFL27_27555, partial [candidate division CSSED10-310 bacterium]
LTIDASTWTDKGSLDQAGDNAEVELYRFWLRYTAAQFELRCGLQKINFGPAKILRSLMWFDQLDIRDPLRLTKGVNAILGRYYFLDNSNIWLWALYQNDELKGLEQFETDQNKPEVGGRCQFPVPRGEIAISIHHRKVDRTAWESKMTTPLADGKEDRYALDGYWDFTIGFWFEAVLNRMMIDHSQSLWQDFLTFGFDYTFDVGAGVHVMCENFRISTGPEVNARTDEVSTSALSIDFSITILDSITAIGYYDWEQQQTYEFIQWQRAYDNWLVTASIFRSPEDGSSMFSGTGVQCMLIYNH